MSYAKPEARRRFEQTRAARRRAAGLCASCNAKRLPTHSRCQRCLDGRRRST